MYTWQNVNCCVHNIIVGKLWIELVSIVTVTNFTDTFPLWFRFDWISALLSFDHVYHVPRSFCGCATAHLSNHLQNFCGNRFVRISSWIRTKWDFHPIWLKMENAILTLLMLEMEFSGFGVLKSPGNQQAWYWLCRTDYIYCCSRVNFICLGQDKSKIRFKMWIYIFDNLQNNSACSELKWPVLLSTDKSYKCTWLIQRR